MKIKSKLIYRRWTNLLSTTSFYLLSSSFRNISPHFHETYLTYFKTMVVVSTCITCSILYTLRVIKSLLPVSPEGTKALFCVSQSSVSMSVRPSVQLQLFTLFSLSVWEIIWTCWTASKRQTTDQVYPIVASCRYIFENIYYLHSIYFFSFLTNK